jgi:hypothetical protein
MYFDQPSASISSGGCMLFVSKMLEIGNRLQIR